MTEKNVMREVFLEAVHERMRRDDRVFFLSADLGAVALDGIRKDFPGRFINTGIAEQNLINTAAGIALENFTVYAYAIAPFITMRAYEQVRNLCMLASMKKLDVNMIGVGAGLSYDLSGPSHHCLEDIALMRLLPGIEVFSPSDCVLAEKIAAACLTRHYPKYIRLDGKPVRRLYPGDVNVRKGFLELQEGRGICLVSTGYMTQVAADLHGELCSAGMDVGIVDLFALKGFSKGGLYSVLEKYAHIITLEEGFVGRGGLDALVCSLLAEGKSTITVEKFGFSAYVFEAGDRARLHKKGKIDKAAIRKSVEKRWRKLQY